MSNLKAAIGTPEDYNKNLDKNNFPMNTNIALPDECEGVISDLEGFDLGDKEEERKSQMPSINAAKDEDQYMPINALN